MVCICFHKAQPPLKVESSLSDSELGLWGSLASSAYGLVELRAACTSAYSLAEASGSHIFVSVPDEEREVSERNFCASSSV